MMTRIIAMVVGAVVASPFVYSADSGTLSIEQRVAAQKAIEQVYWSHRIWPKENPGPKLPLSEVMPDAAIRAKVEDDLRKSSALEMFWGRPIKAEELQAELTRIASESRDPDMLRELFSALRDDPALIGECLVRPVLADRIARRLFGEDVRFGGLGRKSDRSSFEEWWSGTSDSIPLPEATALGEPLVVPVPAAGGCVDDAWTPTRQDVPDPRMDHVAVWTGSEMIVWGGRRTNGDVYYNLNDGWRYAPATDSWTRIATAPLSARYLHVGVWTGSEMVVWGGQNEAQAFGDGARYNPTSDTWQLIATAGAPSPRGYATAVWSGTQMIVWGGSTSTFLNTGGRYSPATDSWTATSVTNAPSGRYLHTAVWAGTQMIVWGGYLGGVTNTGGRYDPVTDTWASTSTVGAPATRSQHVAVWTGARMLVFGGNVSGSPINGGRYDPSTDSWQLMTNANAPFNGIGRSAVWTGQVMVVWGGTNASNSGRYNPVADVWSTVSTVNIPEGRDNATAVWTGTEMLLWGGFASGGTSGTVHTGGRYNPVSDSWTATGMGVTPRPRQFPSAVWTGSEVILWGGATTSGDSNSGARYSPALDTWTPTSTVNAPSARNGHSAIWTGSRMIVWGGSGGSSGGRYDPSTNTWTATSTVNAPSPRGQQSTVWTGSEMIVWGGSFSSSYTDTGGRYNPATDTWTATSLTGAPTARYEHVAVWTGSRMLVWGGYPYSGGSRYDPVSDTWLPMSTAGEPLMKINPAAVWTGSEMVVWGGFWNVDPRPNAPARYNPATDLWTTGSNVGAPPGLEYPSYAWTGIELLVWGGNFWDGGNRHHANTGGRYNPTSDTWRSITQQSAPSPRSYQGAAWSGAQLFEWGGLPYSANGGEYCACVTPATVYRDADGDGFGDVTKPATGCVGAPPTGYVTNHGDCNDADVSIYPGAPQLCDGKNNNCSDPSWPTVPANEANADGDAFRICAGDCNDADATVFPGAPQLCDGKNNNCSDPSWPTVPANEADADGDGFRICANDCNDANPAIRPNAVDVCNGIDDNCNGLVDDDALGVDTDGDGVHNACDNCRTVSNPTQTDTDGDHVGNVCDNCPSLPNPSQSDVDGDAIGDVCDNCPTASNPSQVDTDADKVGDNCDNCLFDFNPTQSDFDHDGEGDICDVNDGLIYIFGTDDKTYVEWQQETGPSAFNVYTGNLAVLRSSGTYTQAPASNPLASRQCGVTDPFSQDLLAPTAGQVEFSLVTGVTGGVEGSLGTTSAGVLRPNANPCP